jgi:hypothetical protein
MLLHRLDGEVVDLPYMADTLDESGNLAERARPSHPSRITTVATGGHVAARRVVWLKGLARVPIRFQHMMTSKCSLSCICTRSYLKLLRIRGSANPFNLMKPFTHSQKPGPSLTSIPEFVVDSHAAYWNPALVGYD